LVAALACRLAALAERPPLPAVAIGDIVAVVEVGYFSLA
jgi:hypothetical protein